MGDSESVEVQLPVAMAHAPVDTVGMVTDGEDGGLVVEGIHLLWE